MSSICSICGTAKPERQKTCSRHCAGRLRSEAGLNLAAFDCWTPEMAYALGLFYTDGCLGHSSRGCGSWVIRFDNIDLPTVEWWHAFLGAHTRIGTPKKPRHQRPYWSVVSSDRLGDRLFLLGAVPRKSWAEMHLPEMPEKCLPHFVRGLVDGDGTVVINRHSRCRGGHNLVVSITSNSLTFRQELRSLFERLGWSVSGGRISVNLRGASAERFCQWIYETSGPAMARKKQVWLDWQERRKEFGGLVRDVDRYAHRRGLRSQPWHALVGTQPDTKIARLTGKSLKQVWRVRQKLDLPVFVPTKGAA